MWRNLSKQPYLRKCMSFPESRAYVFPSDPIGVFESHRRATSRNPHVGLSRDLMFWRMCDPGRLKYGISRDRFSMLGNSEGYAAAAEALVSTSEEEADEIQELLNEVSKEHKVKAREQKLPRLVCEMGSGEYDVLRKRQIKCETESWEEATKEYQELLTKMCKQKLAPNLPYIKSLFLGWFEPLRDAIAAEQESYKEGTKRSTYATQFYQLPADMMAVITMHKLMGLLMTGRGGLNGSVLVVQAARHIGEAIEHEARVHNFLGNSAGKLAVNRTSEVPDPEAKQVGEIVRQKGDFKEWGQEAQIKVGCHLIHILTETAYIQPPIEEMEDGVPDVRPAFVHKLETVGTLKANRKYGVIKCDPLVHRGLDKTARPMVIPNMPMLVPPIPWTGYDQGAYLFLPSYIMRTHGAKDQIEAVKRSPKQQLQPIFRALNTLGTTKWRVNKRILSIIDRIWANGGGLADMVDREVLPLPEEPDTEDEAEIKKWRWKLTNIKKENTERHSQRRDTELKLAVSRKMKDEEGFYYPHNLDFRGRAYPMHPYLNHLGSDLCRGILEFAEGRPLGNSGLRWLKIHMANVYAGGVDKLSYEGRISFTENNLEDIFDSADRPLEGRRWWLNAEDPFQCLATCMNLAEALRSPSPETTISHMPVHMDGSCNGLQHYAALGRDKIEATAVNLVAGDKPADVYTGIAARVLDIMKMDAAKDPAIDPNAMHARLLINQVDRKLVKQTVMTSVYGVTYIGACDQIKRRLKERSAIDDAVVFACAGYAAKTTLTALGEIFEAARSMMGWLGDCAKVIATENQPVRWTTPLGLPVVQPYREIVTRKILTSLQLVTLKYETGKVMGMQQRTAFPPNFVHSLEGSHMMMTAIACSEAGLKFAGVHDSYWTHACDVDQMNKILREKFVELYEAPILENLLEGFQQSSPGLKFPPLPERGDFDLREVLESPYFFN